MKTSRLAIWLAGLVFTVGLLAWFGSGALLEASTTIGLLLRTNSSLNQNLLAEWTFDSSTISASTTADVSGKGNTAINNGSDNIQTIYITSTSATTWTVPSDWGSSQSTIECVGPGGNGGTGSASNGDPGGGGQGGGYGKVSSPVNIAPGNVLSVQVGAGGSTNATYVKDNTSTTICQGDYGGNGGNGTVSSTGAGGNHTQSNIGAAKTSTGGVGSGTGGLGAPGGGGAGGPNGNGAAGGNSCSGLSVCGGGGGGGASGGTTPSSPTVGTGVGANGGTGGTGGGGGAGGTSDANGVGGNGVPTSPYGGGGGGGGFSGSIVAQNGGNGASGEEWDQTHGTGGGGGGPSLNNHNSTPGTGGAGGLYGGGGAGGSYIFPSGTGGAGGAGAQGIIVIKYGSSNVSTTQGRLGQAARFASTSDMTVNNTVNGVESIAFWIKTNNTSTSILQLASGVTVTVVSGTITTTGITSPTIYVDGAIGSIIDGNWHHIVITTATPITANSIMIGEVGNTSNLFSGALDDIRLYSSVLTQDNITRLYHLGATTKVATTISTEPNLLNGLVGWWTFDGKNMLKNVADSSGQGNNGLLSGFTSTTTVPGPLGGALSFNGVNQCVVLPANNSMVQNVTGVTLSAWIKPGRGGGTVPGLLELSINNGGSPTTNSRAALELKTSLSSGSTDASFSARSADTDSEQTITTSNQPIKVNQWINFTATVNYQTSAMQIYLNGVLAASGTGTFSQTSTQNTSSAVAAIGAQDNCGSQFYSGAMDDVRVYDRTLSSAEILRLYQLGATTKIATTINTEPNLDNGLVGWWTFDGPNMLSNVADSSGQGNTGFLKVSTTTAPGKFGQALFFNGTSQFVNVGTGSSLNITGAFTISAWIDPIDMGGGSLGRIFDKTGATNTGYVFSLDGVDVANGIKAYANNNLSGWQFISAANTIALNKWQHVVVTYDGSKVLIYVNNVAVVNQNTSTNPLSSSAVSGTIGDKGDQTRLFHGAIDDVRVYNRALSKDEVARLYQLGI